MFMAENSLMFVITKISIFRLTVKPMFILFLVVHPFFFHPRDAYKQTHKPNSTVAACSFYKPAMSRATYIWRRRSG